MHGLLHLRDARNEHGPCTSRASLCGIVIMVVDTLGVFEYLEP